MDQRSPRLKYIENMSIPNLSEIDKDMIREEYKGDLLFMIRNKKPLVKENGQETPNSLGEK